MRMKFFTVPVFDGESAEAELNRFLAQHRVLSAERRLVDAGMSSSWTVCVNFVDPAQVNGEATAVGSTKRNKIDYRAVLSEEEFAVYAKLRELRKTFADEAGIPAYAVFTNDQLAAMVRTRVKTKAALAKIEGVGDAKLKKYGEAFLRTLAELFAPARGQGEVRAAS